MPIPLIAAMVAKKLAGAAAAKVASGAAGKVIPTVIKGARRIGPAEQVAESLLGGGERNPAFQKQQQGYADKAKTIGEEGFVAPALGSASVYANALEGWASKRRPTENPVVAAGYSTPTLVGQKAPLSQATDAAMADAAEETQSATTDPRFQAWLDRYKKYQGR